MIVEMIAKVTRDDRKVKTSLHIAFHHLPEVVVSKDGKDCHLSNQRVQATHVMYAGLHRQAP